MVNLRAAVDLLSTVAAKSSEGASVSGGDKKRRGDTDRNRRANASQANGGDRGSIAMEDAWAMEVTSMKQFGTLKGILESHPDRYPSPTDEG